jgi:hypothetical protein
MPGKLIVGLRPTPFDHLDEAKLNAALAGWPARPRVAPASPAIFLRVWGAKPAIKTLEI